MNDLVFLIQQTMFFFIPLMLVALGGLFAERSGIINIGLEGIMIIGAFSGIFFIHFCQDYLPPQLCLLIAVIIAGASGVLFSLFHAIASINMKADQTISGTALNMFAPAFAIFVARLVQRTQQVEFSNTFRITKIPVLGDIPIIGPFFFQNTYFTTYLGMIILVLSWVILYKTKFGLRLRSCGELPQAADSAGINVYKMRYAGTLISGFLGGIGGLVFIVPTSTNFNASVAGYGFLAIAVLIFGQWHPWKICGAAFFFGFMKTISSTGLPFLVINNYYYKILPYIATLIVLAFTSKNSAAPRAEGEPYDKGKR